MGHDKILTDHHPQAILRHIWKTSKNAEFFFFEKLPPCTAKTVFENPKGGPFGSEKTVFAAQGGNFSKKKFCIFRSLSNMFKNGLRMVVSQNFDITHLSDYTVNLIHLLKFYKCNLPRANAMYATF